MRTPSSFVVNRALAWCAGILQIVLATALPMANAQDPASTLSFEQLIQREVYGVSRLHERLIDAPASVTIITAEDIRTFGYRTLAEALNGVRGTFMHSDRVYGYLGVRGFAPPGDFNTRVLLLIDGYRANDNVYDQAPLGGEGIIDIDLVERIEYIRGPGSLVYGNNALLGVINVITKTARSAGSGAWAGIGSGGARWGRASVQTEFAPNAALLLSASRLKTDGLDIVQPDLEERTPRAGRAARADGEEQTRVFAKLAFGDWRINAGFSNRPTGLGFGIYGGDFAQPDSRVQREAQSFVDARFESHVGDDTLMARAFAGRYEYRDRVILEGEALRTEATGHWSGAEAQWARWFGSRMRLLAGIEAQHDGLQKQSTYFEQDRADVSESSLSGTRAGAFARVDQHWSERLAGSLGLRVDRAAGGERTFNPRGAVVWQPAPGSALKFSAGSAFRAPNAYERFQEKRDTTGAPSLRSERLRTVEVSYDAIVGQGTRVGLSAYRYRASRLIVIRPDVINGSNLFRNAAGAAANGIEFEIEHRIAPGLRARGALSLQKATDDHGERLDNSPRAVGRADIAWDFTDTWRVGAEMIGVSERRTDAAGYPGYALANLTLSTSTLVRGWDLRIGVHNLADRRAYDPVASLAGLGSGRPLPQPGRTVFLRFGYRF